MNSRIIKCVAGSGKTTQSKHMMERGKNGLYIAYTNKVVNEMRDAGLMGKTIDSLFQSYIIPKFIRLFPLVSTKSRMEYVLFSSIPPRLRAIEKVSIDPKDGTILFGRKRKAYSLYSTRNELPEGRDDFFIKIMFSDKVCMITDRVREQLSLLIINRYPDELLDILRRRFSFIIIDEAQDLKGYREKFAELLHASNIETTFLGDDNQNIMGGGKWFENLRADKYNNQSHRCPRDVCGWIRENLGINIIGDERKRGSFQQITYADTEALDDGARVLLYPNINGRNGEVVRKWNGKKYTIRTAKGLTIDDDIVVIGNKLSKRNLYTALTRTTKNAYCAAKVK